MITSNLLDTLRKLDLTGAPKSYQVILDSMMASMMAKTGITDIAPGSVLLTLLETLAKEVEKK